VGECEGAGNDGPSSEMGTGFGFVEARVVDTAGTVGAAYFEHVGVGPGG
jgi:hypothetical protein